MNEPREFYIRILIPRAWVDDVPETEIHEDLVALSQNFARETGVEIGAKWTTLTRYPTRMTHEGPFSCAPEDCDTYAYVVVWTLA